MNWLSSLAMGGYAAYVWSAYAVFGVVVFGHIYACRRHRKASRVELKNYFNKGL